MTPFGPVTTEIDYDRPGLQLSSLRVAQSRNDSAWHTIHIPIAVVNGGRGPTVLLTGGVHGDEFEGPVVLLKFLRRIKSETLNGRVIVLPALNFPAVEAGHRLSPIDGKDLNRSFSGEPPTSATLAIAAYVEAALLPISDIILDIHSGGYSMMFLPCIWMNDPSDRDLHKRMISCAQAFAAPITLVTPPLACGAMSDSAERIGRVYLSTEVAGGGMLSPASMAIVESGLQRLLAFIGIIAPDETKDLTQQTRFMQISANGYVEATTNGLLEPSHELGDVLKSGDAIGYVHCIERPEQHPVIIPCPNAGTLVGRRAPVHVRRGDGVAVIAQDLQVEQ